MAEDVISYNTLLHDGMSIGVLIKKRAIYNIVSKILKIHCQIYLVISTITGRFTPVVSHPVLAVVSHPIFFHNFIFFIFNLAIMKLFKHFDIIEYDIYMHYLLPHISAY